jgi:hypothetical protein
MSNINGKWRDVSQELYKKWAMIFYDSQEGINLSASCYECRDVALQRPDKHFGFN